MITKKWWQSVTLWANITAVIIIGIQAGLGQIWIPAGYQAGLLAVLNAVLRILNSQPIEGTPGATAAFKRAMKARRNNG